MVEKNIYQLHLENWLVKTLLKGSVMCGMLLQRHGLSYHTMLLVFISSQRDLVCHK